HQFKFGFSWLHAVKNQELQANTQGTAAFGAGSFSGDSYVNFLLGVADSFTQLQYLAGKHWVNNNYAFYGNDNWRVNSRLTLNLGLRYDALPHAFERYDQFANFVPDLYDRAQPNPMNPDGTLKASSLTPIQGQNFYLNGIRLAGVNGFPRGNVQNYYNTFEPRVGFAYNVGGDGKTVVRGGAGLFFERVQGNDVYNAALNPPFAYQPSATNVYFSNPNTSAINGTTTSQTFPSTMTVLGYNYRPPGTAMFSLGIQRQVATSVVAVVQYVGSRGWDQSDDRAINTLPLTANDPAAPGQPYYDRQGVAGKIPDPSCLAPNPPCSTPKFLPPFNANLYRQFPGFSSITIQENKTNFAYNSLQAGVRMENRHGLTIQLAYTWSHEIDNVSNDLNQLSNPFDPAYDRGSGALDRRHIFNANYVYAIPFLGSSSSRLLHGILGCWEFSGVTVAQSGVPVGGNGVGLTYTGPDVLGLGGVGRNRVDRK